MKLSEVCVSKVKIRTLSSRIPAGNSFGGNQGIILLFINGYCSLKLSTALENWMHICITQISFEIQIWFCCPFQCILYHGFLQWELHKCWFKSALAEVVEPDCENWKNKNDWSWLGCILGAHQPHQLDLRYHQPNDYATMNVWPECCPALVLLVVYIDDLQQTS